MLLVYSENSVKFSVQPGESVSAEGTYFQDSFLLFEKFKIEIVFRKIRKILGYPVRFYCMCVCCFDKHMNVL